jgi:Na+/H+-dicarboxylate symporter
MTEAYACMMHHPHGFQIFIALCVGAGLGVVFAVATALTLLDHTFRKPISVPTFSPIPEFNDGH